MISPYLEEMLSGLVTYNLERNKGGTADNPPSFSGTGVFYIQKQVKYCLKYLRRNGGMLMDSPGWWLQP